MRKGLAVVAVCGSMLAVGVGSASADPPGGINGHNCAGVVVSSLAGPGFGQLVSAAAHQQQVDNFGLRNCGQANGKNP